MRHLRPWLLVLVCLLLPLLGALAGAAPCATQEPGFALEVEVAPAAAQPSSDCQDHQPPAPGKCNSPQPCCLGAALPAAGPSLPLAFGPVPADFAEPLLPLAEFLVEGQERPPRQR